MLFLVVRFQRNHDRIWLSPCQSRLLRRSRWSPAHRVASAGRRRLSWRAPALTALARVYAAETESTPTRVNMFNPGPTRTRMRAAVMPGEDPMTLPTPELVAEKILPLCLPSCSETGKLYDFRAGKFLQFTPPA